MTPAERAEAERTAAALVGFVIDEDAASARALLGGCSRQVLAQAFIHLAVWVVRALGDMAPGFRRGLAEELRQAAAGERPELHRWDSLPLAAGRLCVALRAAACP